MDQNNTYLTDQDGKTLGQFAYDHSFWSFDGYKKDDQGVYIKKNKNSSY